MPVVIARLLVLVLGVVLASRKDILWVGKLAFTSVAVAGMLLAIAEVDAYLDPQQDVAVTCCVLTNSAVAFGDDALAVTRESFRERQIINDTVDGQPVVIAWFPEHETVGGFSRQSDGKVVEVTEIDVYGNTPGGKLERVDMFSEVYWMVWAHFHPETRLLM